MNKKEYRDQVLEEARPMFPRGIADMWDSLGIDEMIAYYYENGTPIEDAVEGLIAFIEDRVGEGF